MRTHQEIDTRSLALARAVVAKIDADPSREGLRDARENCARWLQTNPLRAIEEWQAILEQDWDHVRLVLLDESENGKRLRQSNPFCGVLSPRERWDIYEQFSHEHSTT